MDPRRNTLATSGCRGACPARREERAYREYVRTLIKIKLPPSGCRGACPARREERAYREYVSNEQRRGAGCIGGQNGNFILVSVLSDEQRSRVGCIGAQMADVFLRGSYQLRRRPGAARFTTAIQLTSARSCATSHHEGEGAYALDSPTPNEVVGRELETHLWRDRPRVAPGVTEVRTWAQTMSLLGDQPWLHSIATTPEVPGCRR